MKEKKKISKQDEGKVKAFVASFFIIIGFIIALIIWRKEEYVMYYAKHGLVLFIGQLILGIFPYIVMRWFTAILWIFWAILWVMTWIYALSGEKKKVFIITDLAEKIKL
ncbi:MAG: hypothetical protein RL557_210 [archaeon]|jgi:uncharacterized membrane protein